MLLFLGIVFLGMHFILFLLVILNFKNTPADYKPMLFYFLSIFILEGLIIGFGYNSEVVRILIRTQAAIAFLLVIWQAKRLKIFQNLSYFKAMLGFMLAVGVIELIIKGRNKNDIPWYVVIYAFIIVLLAIELLKRQLSQIQVKMINNPVVLFSIGLIIYYSFTMLLDIFMIIAPTNNVDVKKVGFVITIILGIISSFLYLRAVLCIPKQAK